MYKPYYEVVKICFPKAIFVADPFHYTRYIEEGLDKVRLRLVHQYEENKQSYEYKMLKNRVNRKLILKSFYETKGELRKKKEQEEKYKQGKSKKKPIDKFNVYKEYGRVYVDLGDYEYDEVCEEVKKVFGVVGVCPAVKVLRNNEEDV